MKTDNAQLAAFAAVLRCGSFDAAAQLLHVTPSAISQRIRLLEERMGQVLLQRTTPCRPTQAGKALSRFAEQVTLLEAEMLGEIGAPDSGEAARLRVPLAVNADSLDSWFMAACEDLLTRCAVVVDVRVEDQDHSAALLREGGVMAAVSASPAAIQGCSVESLGVMRYQALASPAFRQRHFAGGVDGDALAKAPMLTFNRKDALQARFLRLFGVTEIQPPTHFIPSSLGFLEAVRRGLAWGMIPEGFLGRLVASDELEEIAPGYSLDIPLYWHRWRFSSPVLDALSKAVRQAAASGLRPPDCVDPAGCSSPESRQRQAGQSRSE